MPLLAPQPLGQGPIRQAIVHQVRALVGGTGDDTVERNRQDTGFFGPDSACWKVHGDFTSMMVGGIAALLMQMLHPGALAGVWDHSNFRSDMAGRLRRTARFIAGTTYGDRAEAQGHIDRVRAIHARVAGTLPDGAAYSADDPDLLTWVHAAEVSAFLAAYLRYVDPGFPPAEQDRYFRETAEIARRLGAVCPPQSRAEMAAYLRAVRPKLRYDRRTREVARALFAQAPPNVAAAPAMALVFDAARDLLPDWAASLHGFHISVPRRGAARLGVQVLGRTVRWAIVNSAETRARRRAEQLALEAANGAGRGSRSGR
ncbi:MAG TPA: oxygenase MpaB family protein [Phenylobacterium sp.]|uniref:oxygenase MpaB family protein n=1 Tax=Phenylobacterium sp. TaxID=1871053 RepID=UPI002B46340C|nr:oxygenase MpaB family protein [Phenylobacterium sp.]HKR87659.1 oxygenase MpaB family protein [Phenylobacterium sp.]